MAQTAPLINEIDPVLVHHFIRLHGRRPRPDEVVGALLHHRTGRTRVGRLLFPLRRATARLILRL